jgi:chromosome segregation ATPase
MPWHSGALQKFYALSAQAAGLRSPLSASRDRHNDLRRSIADLEAERDALTDTIASAPVLSGRDADRHRTHDRVAEIDGDLLRLQSALSEMLRSIGELDARRHRLEPLLNACGALLLKLRLLRPEESL